VQRVILSGDLDYSTESHTRAVLAEAIATDDQEVVADGGAVTFIDSSGLRALLAAQAALAADGRHFSIRNTSSAMRRVIEISGLAEYVDVR
jgi:anti-anti-sigma factor